MNLYNAIFESLEIVFWLSLPAILTAIVAGFLVGLIQALTSIQDQTLPQGVKLICVIICIAITAKSLGVILLQFTNEVFTNFNFVN